MSFAPILISVYDRLEHLKQCVESLQKCNESKASTLYIVSDNYQKLKDKEKVDSVRNYISNIKGFEKVIGVFNDLNLGSTESVRRARDLVLNANEKFIFLEDDVVVSPLFLTYVNTALDYYEDDSKVFSICGFSPLILSKTYKASKSEIIFSNQWNPWGYGSWKKKFKPFLDYRYSDKLQKDLTLDISSPNFRKKIEEFSFDHYTHLLFSQIENKMPAFDYNVDYYCLKNSMVNVFNSNTFTLNKGNDGSGLNAVKDTKLQSYMVKEFSYDIPKFSKQIVVKVFNSYEQDRAKSFLKNILIKLRLFSFFKYLYRKIF
ncbi:MAG: hypothetical protein ABF260_09565 [Flavobacteriaceae bacterium]